MVKQYKAHFSYRILQNEKNICTEHQNMRTIVSSPAVYHVGIMTRLMSILTRLQNQREYKTEKLHRSQQVDAHEK